MKMKRNLSHLSTLTAVSLILAAGPSLAQTADVTEGGGSAGTTEASAPAESGSNTTNEGAFQALSPGGQKIARALFDAQKQPATDGAGGTGSTTGGTSATTGADGAGTTEAAAPLSLDDIAAAKASGTGWGRVFKEMKAEGLIAEKNLGQVISGANHRNRLTGSGTPGTTAATSTTTTSLSVSPSGHRTKPVTVTLANGATVVVGGQGRGHAPRGDADADATGSKSGTNRSHGGGFGTAGGHGHKQGLAAGAAGRDFGALLGNGVSAGNSGHGSVNSGHGSINSGPGSVNSGPGSINSGHGSVTAGSGVSHGGGHGSGKGSGR
ncbi:MAG: hypothetical protein HYY38_01915 [Rhodospirillales bacterium]|nr:hypothetical protein [Rhodospirillales bacterium]